MGGIKLRVHPLFFIFGLYFAATRRIFIFLIYTLCALAHELGHSFQASALGYKLKQITLMPFGAVISGDTEDLKPADQFKIALAGPLLNLGVALLFIALWWVMPEIYAFTDVIVEANLSLAIINFLPAYPLDGGRVLCSALSTRLKRKTAVKICRVIGVVIATALLGLFIASCFYTVNISLLFFSAFIFVGALDGNKENSYARAYTILNKDKLLKGVAVKRQAVDKSVTVKKALSLLDSEAVNELQVYADGEPIAVLGQKKINEIIENGDIYAPISKYLA